MRIALVGLSHKTSPLEVRERLALSSTGLGQFLEECRRDLKVAEIVGLVTCNRTEITFTVPDDEAIALCLRDKLIEAGRLRQPLEAGALYLLWDEEAVRHLFRVAASLDSLVVGEAQILGQIKEAYAGAVGRGLTGPLINKLYQRSFNVAKRVRTETDLGSRPVSIPSAAVELARKIFGDFASKEILLLGSGEVARLALKGFQEYGATRFMVASRSFEKAREWSATIGATPLPLELLSHGLEEADIVLTSLGAPETVVSADLVRDVMGRRRHRPMFFIDVAVPRNVAPEVNAIFNVYLYSIDDLKAIVDEHCLFRSVEAGKAEEIIDQAVEAFYQEMRAQEVSPTIATLTAKFEEIRRREVDKALAKLNGLGFRHREVVEACTTSIVQKILHEPIIALKSETSHEGRNRAVEFLKRLFGI